MKSGRSSLFVLVVIFGFTSTKIYDRCDLARELWKRLDGNRDQVPTWVCIAFYESNFNTSAIGRLNGNWSWDHGLFQLSDRYWCGRNGVAGVCKVPCLSFRDDDLEDDLRCIEIIFKEHQKLSGNGFSAWATHRMCRGQNAQKFIEGCANTH
ncbi:lysozyme C, milk isozyme-like [Athalia rosae]|uniref:lysozyme C, milk isozyme-like n=1 Tax=Athalia rosae TaxID=37344 RepID=UPI0020348A4A|nr:lysozyme C, milk isozyme-like [Athalia rosae]